MNSAFRRSTLKGLDFVRLVVVLLDPLMGDEMAFETTCSTPANLLQARIETSPLNQKMWNHFLETSLGRVHQCV